MKSIKIFYLVFLVFVFSCGGGNTSNEDNLSEAIEASTIKFLSLSDFNLQLPENWKLEQPENTMRVAQISIKENPEYKVAVFYFGQQDMVDANIDRWKKQFVELEDFEELVIESDATRMFKFFGTFKAKEFPMAKDFTETPNYGTLAAIIKSATGPYYFKLSAPKGIIIKSENEFKAMLESYKTRE